MERQPSMWSWSIRARLLVGSCLLALVTAAVGAWSLVELRASTAAFRVAATDSLPAVDHLLQADRDMHQALVAERTLMFMRQGTPESQRQAQAHAEALARVAEHWAAYGRLATAGDERAARSAFEAAWSAWSGTTREVLKILAEDTAEARRDAIDLSTSEGEAKFDRARQALHALEGMRLEAAHRHAGLEERRAARGFWWVSAAVVAAFAGAVAVGLVLARSVSRPLAETAALLREIAEGDGDLTRRLAVRSHDEIGEMARWFNVFVEHVGGIVARVGAAAQHVATASRQLSAGAAELSTGAQRQASTLAETARSVTEITATVRRNAEGAGRAGAVAAESRSAAEQGGQVVTSAIGAMDDIRGAASRIADITGTIDEIAFQTNLLALNAAVEAARAGDQGRGFAVVAAEVRALAGRAGAAAKEIKTLIEDSVTKVEAGVTLVNRSGATLTEMVAGVGRVGSIVADIAEASREQATRVDHVERAVAHVEQVVQETASQTEEVAATADSLATQAAELQALVARFTLHEHPVGPGALALPDSARRRPAVLAGATA
jgi:methyl-accepting chemotaxis protein